MSLTIKEFLFYENKTITQAAKDLMVSRTYLSQVSLGKFKPSIRLAKAIEEYTNHQVKAEYLMKKKV